MKKLLTLVTLLFLLTSGAHASLLGSPQVRRELGLSHENSVLILRDLNETARLSQGGISYNAAPPKHAKTPALSAADLQRRAMNRLTPAQKQRLEQIELQMGDPFVLQNWKVAQRVGLSRAQHDELSRIIDRAFKRRVSAENVLFKRDQSWWMQVDHKKYAARYAAHDRQYRRIGDRYRMTVQTAADRILTPTQKAKWAQIKGKPFKAKLTFDVKSYPID